jgi:glutathione peroxidase
MKLTVASCALALAATVILAAPEKPMSFYNLTAKTLDGQVKDLAEYKGQVLLVVNTASQCGYTPQYQGLEKLYEDYKPKGVVVLGFPSNDFGGQEPGTAAEIKTFCETKYHEVLMFDKVKMSGEGQSPVYAFPTQSPRRSGTSTST